MRFGVEYMPGPNVGDGIYQLSVVGLIRGAFPEAQVACVDGPLLKTFAQRPRFAARVGLGRNALDITAFQEVDCLCLSGPILGSDFMSVYGPRIRAVQDRGGSYFIVSAHCPGYSEELIKFLSQHPPLGIATRDRPSYDALLTCGVPLYDGVCAALLVSQTCDVPSLTADFGPYISVTVDKSPEPRLAFDVGSTGAIELKSVDVGAYVPRKRWKVTRHLDFARLSQTASISGYRVVRPVHDISYKFSHLNYARSAAFLSYLPNGYLSLYESTSLTVSDRVHSCAPTLSYGNPAIFLGSTPRAAIFDRVGATDGEGTVMTLSRAVVEKEHQALLQWLRSTIR